MALSIPNQQQAMINEMNVLQSNNIWGLVTLLSSKPTMSCKWVFTIKFSYDGTSQKFALWLRLYLKYVFDKLKEACLL